MPQQGRMPGTAREKRNCWMRGNGAYSFRGELRRGIALNKKHLSRKVRRSTDVELAPKGNAARRRSATSSPCSSCSRI